MTKQDTLNLIERLENATGPDRELDALIACIQYAVTASAEYPAGFVTNRFGYTHPCPQYTYSLDAAMTLVPDGYRWSAGITDGEWSIYAVVRHRDEGGNPTLKWAAFGNATPALALCIAALKSREAKQ